MAVQSPTLPTRYRDPRPVGRGGMADIYRATDGELGRTVAVKLLAEHCAEDEDIRKRFLCEARAAARLSGDPHSVTIYDVGEVERRPYIVMEYLPGGSLAARIASGRINRAHSFEWLQQAARALDAAHAHGVVHRDVKPGNLLLDKDDNVYVADFGIARAAGVDSNTQTGVILGTAGYLAPEQAAGGRAVPASDQYALAVVAYELLTGARPGPVPSRKLPPGAHAVFGRALAEEPEERYPSCLDFVAALRSTLVDPTLITRRRTVVVARRRYSRRLPPAIAALLLGAIAFLVTAALSTGNPGPPESTVVQTVTLPARTTPAATTVQSVAQVSPTQPSSSGNGKHKGGKKKKPKHGRG